MNPFDDQFPTPATTIFDGPPPAHLTSGLEPAPEPMRPGAELPDITRRIEDVTSNPSAKLTDQLGQALRAGLGIGALAMLPELIEDLRRTKDPDSRLKFLSLAFKEGGYGTKEDKTANLPVFHFNFVGSQGAVTVTASETPAADEQIEDATYTVRSQEQISTESPAVQAINDDFSPAASTDPRTEVESVFDLIDQG